jgi:hypothetical protein
MPSARPSHRCGWLPSHTHHWIQGSILPLRIPHEGNSGSGQWCVCVLVGWQVVGLVCDSGFFLCLAFFKIYLLFLYYIVYLYTGVKIRILTWYPCRIPYKDTMQGTFGILPVSFKIGTRVKMLRVDRGPPIYFEGYISNHYMSSTLLHLCNQFLICFTKTLNQ